MPSKPPSAALGSRCGALSFGTCSSLLLLAQNRMRTEHEAVSPAAFWRAVFLGEPIDRLDQLIGERFEILRGLEADLRRHCLGQELLASVRRALAKRRHVRDEPRCDRRRRYALEKRSRSDSGSELSLLTQPSTEGSTTNALRASDGTRVRGNLVVAALPRTPRRPLFRAPSKVIVDLLAREAEPARPNSSPNPRQRARKSSRRRIGESAASGARRVVQNPSLLPPSTAHSRIDKYFCQLLRHAMPKGGSGSMRALAW